MDRGRKQLVAGALTLQLLHVLVFVFLKETKIASNVLQVFIGLMAAKVCWRQGRLEPAHSQQPWHQLSSVFLMWTAAQVAFLVDLFVPSSLWYPAYNILWLLFPFPLIVVASRRSQSSERDPASWLDLAQACIFFSTLFALVFSRPAIMSLAVAYEVQSVALALVVALRFSVTQRGPERLFYRNVTVFAVLYALLSTVGSIAEVHGFPSGSIVDLCWVIPFTVFSVLAMLDASPHHKPRRAGWLPDPAYLLGVSALGLAAMSLGASGILALHQHLYGGIVFLSAFLLFAIRTNLRERQSHRFSSQLEHAVMHDPLTQLGNRALLQFALKRSLEEERGNSRLQTAVLFLDIDHFKTINDDFGHAFGDALLKRVAMLLRSALRSEDTIARQGGDEFVLVLNQVDLEGAETLANKILAMLRMPIRIEGRVVEVTASVGLALGGLGDDADTLLQNADCAMYQAKQSGKDQLQVFTSSMLANIKIKNKLVSALRGALADRSLEVHYQPIYGLADSTISGFEALVRWNHPDRGMISPAEFIPVAEDTGLIYELGKQVLREACAQCHAWNQKFEKRLSVNVNVSAHQFADPDLFPMVVKTLDETGLDPSLLKLEITESVLLSGYEKVADILTGLRDLGVVICLDDFGTGYSSLSYLLNFPIDIVKIDKSFVSHLDREYARAEVVRSIIQLSRKLHMQVVAEGVETVEELGRLEEFDCEMVQGYLLSKPMNQEAIGQLFLADRLQLPCPDRYIIAANS